MRVEVRIANGADNAEEHLSSGKVTVHDAKLIFDADHWVGLRFRDLRVPQGASIRTSAVTFVAHHTRIPETHMFIYGEAADNSAPLQPGPHNLSARPRTAAHADWAPGSWITQMPYDSADVTAVLQEIVNRDGWRPGNAVTLVVAGKGGQREAYAYDGDPGKAPTLRIEWTEHGVPGAADASGEAVVSTPAPGPSDETSHSRTDAVCKLEQTLASRPHDFVVMVYHSDALEKEELLGYGVIMSTLLPTDERAYDVCIPLTMEGRRAGKVNLILQALPAERLGWSVVVKDANDLATRGNPYVVLGQGSVRVQTSVRNETQNPVWNETLELQTGPSGRTADGQPPTHPPETPPPSQPSDFLKYVKWPRGTAELPDGSFKLPNGMVQFVDGSLQLPDGSMRSAQGVVTLPSGAAAEVLPDGCVRLSPGFGLLLPDGGLKRDDGSVCRPDGTVQLPDGTCAKADGSVCKARRSSFHMPGFQPPKAPVNREPAGPGDFVVMVFHSDKDHPMGQGLIPATRMPADHQSYDVCIPLTLAGSRAGKVHLILQRAPDEADGPAPWQVTIKSAQDLVAHAPDGSSDPYVVVSVAGAHGRTSRKDQTLSPEWNETVELRRSAEPEEPAPSPLQGGRPAATGSGEPRGAYASAPASTGALTSVKWPRGTAELPDGSFKLPNGMVQFVDGSLQLPDGSMRSAQGVVTLPSGAAAEVLPDGCVRLSPGFGLLLPDGGLKRDDGAICFLDGLLQLPDGTFQEPDGSPARAKTRRSAFQLPGFHPPMRHMAAPLAPEFEPGAIGVRVFDGAALAPEALLGYGAIPAKRLPEDTRSYDVCVPLTMGRMRVGKINLALQHVPAADAPSGAPGWAIVVMDAVELLPQDGRTSCDPCVVISWAGTEAKTSVRPQTLQPAWGETLVLPTVPAPPAAPPGVAAPTAAAPSAPPLVGAPGPATTPSEPPVVGTPGLTDAAPDAPPQTATTQDERHGAPEAGPASRDVGLAEPPTGAPAPTDGGDAASPAPAAAGAPWPPGTAELPDGGLQLPNGMVVRPGGRLTLPDGSVRAADGAVTLPDGTPATVLPDGSVPLSEGFGVLLPDGGMRLADGSICLPEGARQLPDGVLRMPDGSRGRARQFTRPLPGFRPPIPHSECVQFNAGDLGVKVYSCLGNVLGRDDLVGHGAVAAAVLPADDRPYDVGVPLALGGEPAGKVDLVLRRAAPRGWEVTVKGAQGLPADGGALPDPYAVVLLGRARAQTRVERQTASPRWAETLRLEAGDDTDVAVGQAVGPPVPAQDVDAAAAGAQEGGPPERLGPKLPAVGAEDPPATAAGQAADLSAPASGTDPSQAPAAGTHDSGGRAEASDVGVRGAEPPGAPVARGDVSTAVGAGPGGAVRWPLGTARLPDGSLRLPNGVVLQPDGGYRFPDGSRRAPDGVVTLPGGARAAVLPDGAVQLSEGFGRLLPDGSLQLVDGSICLSDGSLQLWDGAFETPDGRRWARARRSTARLPGFAAPQLHPSGLRFAPTDLGVMVCEWDPLSHGDCLGHGTIPADRLPTDHRAYEVCIPLTLGGAAAGKVTLELQARAAPGAAASGAGTAPAGASGWSVLVKSAHDLLAADPSGLTDSYVALSFGGAEARTTVQKRTRSPFWGQALTLDPQNAAGPGSAPAPEPLVYGCCRVLPRGAVMLPDGSVRRRDGSVVLADGTQAVAGADGAVVLGDGSRLLPHGLLLLPHGGSLTLPPSALQAPDAAPELF